MINPKVYTEFGDAWRRGEFDHLPKESLEYKELWEEQLDRCLNGYSVGGNWISGSLYGYANFGTILKTDDFGKAKELGAPDLRDVELMLDYHKTCAIEAGKNLLYVSGRRLGKSYYGSWELADNFTFHKSEGALGFYMSSYGNDLLAKVRIHLSGLHNTPFYMPLLKDRNDEEALKAGWEYKDSTGRYVKKELGGILYFVNFHQNHTAANGKSTRRFVFEEIGMFDNLIQSYNSSEFCWKEGERNFGFALLHGTGGDMEGGSIDLEQMFYDPETYGLHVFHDELSPQKKQCLFIHGMYSLNEARDENGFIIEDKALDILNTKRETLKNGRKLEKLFQEMQYRPFTAQEAFLKSGNNVFPRAEIQQQLQLLESNKSLDNIGIKGHFVLEAGKPKFKINNELVPCDFPVNPEKDNTGCVVIWEHPVDNPPHNLYIIAVDPYAQDTTATSVSLGSCFVYKRIHTLSTVYDLPVAEYTGRPQTTNEFFEGIRRLALYYNAKVQYEINTPGLKQYFETQNSFYMLAPSPSILKDIVPDSKVTNSTGVHVSKKVKLHLINLIKNWLLTPYAENRYNVDKIYSKPLLKELLNYDADGNFDRIIAFGLCLLQDEEHYKTKIPLGEVQGKFQNSPSSQMLSYINSMIA